MDIAVTIFLLWLIGSAAWFYTEKAIALFRNRKEHKNAKHSCP